MKLLNLTNHTLSTALILTNNLHDTMETMLMRLDPATLREEILAGRNFGGFGGFVKNPPKSAKLTSRQNYHFSSSAKLNSRQNYHFSSSAKLNASQNYYFSPSAKFFLVFVNYLRPYIIQSTTAISNFALFRTKVSKT